MLHDGGLKTLLEQRDQIFANVGAGPCGVAIGGIFAPGLFFCAEVRAQIGTAQCKERADNGAGVARHRVNSAKSGEAGAAKDVSEHGFGLIVGGVGYGDSGGVAGGDKLIEKGVTRAAPGVFEIGLVPFGVYGDIGAPGVEGEGVFRGEGGDEFFVCVGGAAAELMIEVGDGEDDPEFSAELQQQVEKRDRVGSRGDGDSYAVAGLERLAGADFLQQAG
jgi:hypothetical protein